MAGHELARCNLGNMEAKSGNIERALKHWMIAASAGDFGAMHNLLAALWHGHISRESIDSTLEAYNSCCVEMQVKHETLVSACSWTVINNTGLRHNKLSVLSARNADMSAIKYI
jgi:TPR repeat protein